MPISIDEFESRDPDRGPTNAERVLRFLVRNRDKAYKAAEIARETGVNRNSIHPVLQRLAGRSLVRHREPYWAVGDLDVVRDAALFHATVEFLGGELGSERREEWLATARGHDGEEG